MLTSRIIKLAQKKGLFPVSNSDAVRWSVAQRVVDLSNVDPRFIIWVKRKSMPWNPIP